MKGTWNHNTHYHRLVLDAAPEGTTRALDVGCGEGDLLADLGGVIPDVVGIARPHSPSDYAIESTGVVASRVMRLVRGYKQVQAPTVWPPPMTYAECQQIGRQELPGAVFKRRVFFRYSIVWTKAPAAR